MAGGRNSRWKDDPAVRVLRIASWLTFLGLIVFMVVIRGADNPATFGTLVGALIVYSGFETGIRLPDQGRKKDGSDE